MTKQKEEITQLANWCQEARKILGKGMRGDSSTMENRIKGVESRLKKLSESRTATDKQVFEAGMENFRLLTQDHQKATDVYNEAKRVLAGLKGKEKTPEYERAKEAVNEARESVRALMDDMKTLRDDMESDKPLLDVVRFFEASVLNAENAIRDELTLEHAATLELNGALRLLEQWKNAVQTDPRYRDPKAVKALTLQIKPMLAKLIKGTKAKSSESRKTDLKQSAARGGAEQRLKDAERVLSELGGAGQLTPTHRTAYTDAIQQAKDLFIQEKWIEGEALLKVLPSRKACLQAFDKARLEAELDLGPDIEQARLGLAGVREKCDEPTVQRHTSTFNGLVSRAGDPGRKVKDNAKLVTDFRNFIEQLKTDTRYAVETARTLDGLVESLKQTATRLADIAPLNFVAEHDRQLELIAVLQQQKRWREALDTANLLKEAMARRDDPDHPVWLGVRGEIGPRSALRNALRLAAGNPKATPALREEAGRLSARIEPSAVAILEQARDWAALVALHKEAKAFDAGVDGEIQAYKDFGSGREEIDAAVQPRIQRCDGALFDLERALTQAGADSAPVVGPLRQQLADLKKEWARRMASASNASDLNQAQMEQDLNLLMQAVLSANYGPNLTETVDGQRDAAGRAEFDKLNQTIERDGLTPLDAVSSDRAAQFRREITALAGNAKLETDPATPWAERVKALQALATRVTTALGEAQTECDKLNVELTGKAEAVALTLQAAQKELESKGLWGSLAAKYQPMFDFMLEELEGLKQLLSTTNASAAQGNKLLLADIKTRADKLVLLAKANKGLDGRESRVENAEGRWKDLQKEGLTKLIPETDEDLTTKFADLKRDLYGMEPDVVNQVLDELGRDITAAGQALQTIQDQKTEVTRLEGVLRPRIATLKQSGVAGAYYDTLFERVSAAVKQAATPSELAAAITALKGVETEVGQAEADPKAALARQQTVMQQQHADARLKKEYEGRLQAIKRTVLPRAEKAVTDASGDSGQIDEVKRMIEMAEKAAKGGDHERAVQTLVRTENRVAEIEKNPAGTALGDRKALDKHLQTFASQVQALRDDLDAFVEAAVEEVPDDLREAVRKPLLAAVQQAKTQLNPRVFDPYVPTIGDGKADRARRRDMRDQALQRLREVRTYLTTHPTLTKLALNPIRPVAGAMKLVDSSLTRLEAHLRSAIR
jgi:hypothetical protein